MINYDELKTALTDISNICRMTDCGGCPMRVVSTNKVVCVLFDYTPNNWLDNINPQIIDLFSQRGAHLVEEGYIDE